MAHYQWVYGKITQCDWFRIRNLCSCRGWHRRFEISVVSKMAHCEKKMWAYWNNHTSVGRSRLPENLAVHLCIMRFMTAFVLGSFKSAACQLLCGISDLFPFIYTARNCVLSVQKGLSQFKLYCSLSITARWLRKAPSCILMCMSACERVCAHHGLWLMSAVSFVLVTYLFFCFFFKTYWSSLVLGAARPLGVASMDLKG